MGRREPRLCQATVRFGAQAGQPLPGGLGGEEGQGAEGLTEIAPLTSQTQLSCHLGSPGPLPTSNLGEPGHYI